MNSSDGPPKIVIGAPAPIVTQGPPGTSKGAVKPSTSVQTTEPSDYIQEIGETLAGLSPTGSERVLGHFEVEDGVIDHAVFVLIGDDIRHRRTPPELAELVYGFWDAWRSRPDEKEWRGLAVVVEDGAFKIELTYLDQIGDPDDYPARREAAVTKHFGSRSIRY